MRSPMFKEVGSTMKRALFVCLALLTVCLSLAWASPTYILKVRVQVANVRSTADMDAPVIKMLPQGTLLESVEKTGDWYRIDVEDALGRPVTGYINARVVEVISGGEVEEQAPEPAAEQEPEPEPEPEAVEPEPARPAPRRPARFEEDYDEPKAYGGGGVRLLGGLASSNIQYNKDRTEEASGGIDPDPFIKSRTSYLGGVGFEFGSRLSLELDVLYMPKGVRFEGEYDASAEGMGKVDFKADLIANEVSVPVLLKFRLLPGTTPYVLAGGEVGYILSSSLDWSYTSGDQTEKGKEDLLKKDENGEVYINQLDYGAVFGGGFEVRLAGLTLSVEGRYHLGQANLLKQTKAGEGGGQKDEDYIRSKALVVMAGIKF